MEDDKNKTYMLLALATIFWGVQPLCIKIIVREWTPAALTCLRYLLISGTLFALMYLKNDARILPPRACILPLMIMGLTGVAINNVAQFTGLQYATITNCTLIAATAPALTALLSVVLIRERLTLLHWIGISISFVGVSYLVSKGSLQVFFSLSFNIGDMLFFVCQIVWAIYSLIGLKVMRSISALAATAWSGLFGALIVGGYGIVMDELHYVPLTLPALYSFAFTVFFGGVISMLFWNIGVRNTGPSLSAIFSNLTPVVGMLVGAFALGEVVGWQQGFGAVTIFSGVYLTTHSRQVGVWLSKKIIKLC